MRMKSKKITTYLLLAASIIIWGTIAWRLVKTFKKEKPTVEKTVHRPVAEKTDSVMLVLDYDDPFLKKITNESPSKKEEPTHPEGDFYHEEPELVVHEPTFKFKGILRAGQKTFGLLDLHGETIMVSPRERLGDFLIVSIDSDKLVVRSQGLDIELFVE